ncbi:MAG TPA: hydroxymethylglutaryl-CoA lyase [Candidatus Dormibacteraeota bacterium]
MSKVVICDVGPRDGLQNEKVILEPSVRAELVDRLALAGLPRIEAVSFVNPKLVPAMAGAEEVMQRVSRRPGVVYAGLVLNERGYDRALAAGVDEIHLALTSSDAFGLRNQNQTAEQGLEIAQTLIRRARVDGKRITVTLMVAFGDPFSGRVEAASVLGLVERLLAAPPDEIAFADTIGVGVPSQVRTLVSGARSLGVEVVGVHLHNTRNTGYANALAALDAGATVFDASVGGTGGCPFAPRATGNIATEDLVYMFEGMGVETGISLERLIATSEWLGQRMGKELPGMVAKAGAFEPVAS